MEVAMHPDKFNEVEGNHVLESEKRVDSEETTKEAYETVPVTQAAEGNVGQGRALILARCKRFIAYVNELN